MFSPDDALDIFREITAVYDEMEIRLLVNVAERLRTVGDISQSAAGQWHYDKLQELGLLKTANAAESARLLKGVTQQEIEKLLDDVRRAVVGEDVDKYRAAYRAGRIKHAPVPGHMSWQMQQVMESALLNMRNRLNMVNTTALQSADTSFIRTLNRGYLETASGISTYQEAMESAVVDLAKRGITGFEYQRSDGTVWRMGADTAARRAIVTTVNQASSAWKIQTARDWGANLVEVSSHLGARPEHALWQGAVYSIDGGTDKYPNLAASTGYGTVTGLYGANCRHTMFPFIEGFSEQAHERPDVDANNREYEINQELRRMERNVRNWRKREVTARAAGLDGETQKAAAKSAEHMLKLRTYAREVNRDVRYQRMRVQGIHY